MSISASYFPIGEEQKYEKSSLNIFTHFLFSREKTSFSRNILLNSLQLNWRGHSLKVMLATGAVEQDDFASLSLA